MVHKGGRKERSSFYYIEFSQLTAAIHTEHCQQILLASVLQ